MTSTAIRSQGTTIGLGDGASPEAFTTIANITSWDGPRRSANDIDVSDLSSTAREFLQGLEDSGTVVLEGYYKASNTEHQTLEDNVGSDTAKNFKITFSDSAYITFAARVMEFGTSGGVDGAVNMSMTLKLSGSYTRTTA